MNDRDQRDFDNTAPHYAHPDAELTSCGRAYRSSTDGTVTYLIEHVWCRACLIQLERDVRRRLTSPLSQAQQGR